MYWTKCDVWAQKFKNLYSHPMQTHEKNIIHIILNILYWNNKSVTMTSKKLPTDCGLPDIFFIIVQLLEKITALFFATTEHSRTRHYGDVIMSPIESQITSLRIVYSIVCSGTDQWNIKAPRHWPFRGEFTGNAENVSIWWRHHDIYTHSRTQACM